MASTQATIDLIVRGSAAVNKLITDLGQVAGLVDAINARPIDVASKTTRNRASDLARDIRDIDAKQLELKDSLKTNAATIKAIEADRLATQERLTAALKEEGAEIKKIKAEEEARLKTLDDSLNKTKGEIKKIQALIDSFSLEGRIEKQAALIDTNQILRTENSIKALRNELNKLGDSVRLEGSDVLLSNTTINKQIEAFENYRRAVQQAKNEIESLRAQQKQLGNIEATVAAPSLRIGTGTVADIEAAMSAPNAALERRQRLEALGITEEENRLRQQRNERRREVEQQIAQLEKSLQGAKGLEARAAKAGDAVIESQNKLKEILAKKVYRKGTSKTLAGDTVSLNQLQTQAQALALFANNSEIAGKSFAKFTVAAELASIRLGKAQQNTFKALAGNLAGGDSSEFAGAQNLVKDLISEKTIQGLQRSQASLGSYISLLKQVQSILPFASNEFRNFENTIQSLEAELEGATAQGRLRQDRAAVMRQEERRGIENRKQDLLAKARAEGSMVSQVGLEGVTPEMIANRPFAATAIMNQVERQLKIQGEINKSVMEEAEQRRSAAKALTVQLNILKTLSLDLERVQQSGVSTEAERVRLATLINDIESGRVRNSKASVSLVGEEIKEYRTLLGLRSREAKAVVAGPTSRIGDLSAQTKYAQQRSDMEERLLELYSKIGDEVENQVTRQALLNRTDRATGELLGDRLESSQRMTKEIEKQLELTIKQQKATAANQRQIDILRQGMVNLQQFYRTAAAAGVDVSVELSSLEANTATFTNSLIEPTQQNVDAMREVLRQSTNDLAVAKSRNAEGRIGAANARRRANLENELAGATERAMQFAARLESIMAGTTTNAAVEAQINAAQQIADDNAQFLRDRRAGLAVEREYNTMAKKQADAVGSIGAQYKKLLGIRADFERARKQGVVLNEDEQQLLETTIERVGQRVNNARLNQERLAQGNVNAAEALLPVSTPAVQSTIGDAIKAFGEILRLRKKEASLLEEASRNQASLAALQRDGAKMAALYNKAEQEGLVLAAEKNRLEGLRREMGETDLSVTDEKLNRLQTELACFGDILQIRKITKGVDDTAADIGERLLSQQQSLLRLKSLYNKAALQGAAFSQEEINELAKQEEAVTALMGQDAPSLVDISSIDRAIDGITRLLQLQTALSSEAKAEFQYRNKTSEAISKGGTLKGAIREASLGGFDVKDFEERRKAASRGLGGLGPEITLATLTSIERQFNAELRLQKIRKTSASEAIQNQSTLNALLKSAEAVEMSLSETEKAGLGKLEASSKLKRSIAAAEAEQNRPTKERIGLLRSAIAEARSELAIARQKLGISKSEAEEQDAINEQIAKRNSLESAIARLKTKQKDSSSEELEGLINQLQELSKKAGTALGVQGFKKEGIAVSSTAGKAALDEAQKLLDAQDKQQKNARSLASIKRGASAIEAMLTTAAKQGLNVERTKANLQTAINNASRADAELSEELLQNARDAVSIAATELRIAKEKNNASKIDAKAASDKVKSGELLLKQQSELLTLQALYDKRIAEGIKVDTKKKDALDAEAEKVKGMVEKESQPGLAENLKIDKVIQAARRDLGLKVAELNREVAQLRAKQDEAVAKAKATQLETAIKASGIDKTRKTELEQLRATAINKLDDAGPTNTLKLLSSIERQFNAEARLADKKSKAASQETQNTSRLTTLLERAQAIQGSLLNLKNAGLNTTEAEAKVQGNINEITRLQTAKTKESVSLARDQVKNALNTLRVQKEQFGLTKSQGKENQKLIQQQTRLTELGQTIADIKAPGLITSYAFTLVKRLEAQASAAEQAISPKAGAEGKAPKPSAALAKEALDRAQQLLAAESARNARQEDLNTLIAKGESIIESYNTAELKGLLITQQREKLQNAINEASLAGASLKETSVRELRNALAVASAELVVEEEKARQSKITADVLKAQNDLTARQAKLLGEVQERLGPSVMRRYQQLLGASLRPGEDQSNRVSRAEALFKARVKQLDINERVATQLLDMQNMQNRYTSLEAQGVQFMQEKADLAQAASEAAAKGVKFTQAEVEAFDLLLQRASKYAVLRKSEAIASGTFTGGTGKGAVNLELTRANLLTNALKFQGKLKADAGKLGIDFAKQQLDLEQTIADLRGMKGKSTIKDVNSAALAIKEIKLEVQELINAMGAVSNLTGFEGAMQKFQGGLIEGGAFFGSKGQAQAIEEVVQAFVASGQAGAAGAASLSALKSPAKASTASLELLSGILKQAYANLNPNVKGFKQLEKQIRQTVASLDGLVASRAPDADFLTRMTRSPRMANAISEGLIGGMFPLLFGQGLGASVLGLAGGGLGGFAGGGLGFGLSLLGTALGTMFDQGVQAAQELGKSLNYPIEGFEKLKEANLFASREQEYYISKLIESGQTTKATAEIQAQMIEKVGVNGVNDLMRLADASSRLGKVWAEFTLQLQTALAGPMADLLEWASNVIGAFNRFSGSQQYVADVKNRLTGEERRRFVDELQKIDLAAGSGNTLGSMFGGISQEEAAKQRIALADYYRQFAKPAAPGLRESKKDPKAEEDAVKAQRQVADEIKSAYREGFQLQQKIIDAEKKGAETRRKLITDAFQKQQELDKSQIDIMQKRAQISIETLDLAYQKRISAEEGRTAELLAAEAEYMKTKAKGEADIEARKRSLEIDIAKTKREAEEYVYNLSKDAESIRRDTLSLEMEVLDYRLKIEREIEDTRRDAGKRESGKAGTMDGGIPGAAQIGAKNLTPQEKASLATIRWAETGTSGPESYRMMFGGGLFSDMSRHPDTVVRKNGYASAAAGAYQFMPDTWKRTGGGSMAPERQDAAALWLMLKRGADINKTGFTKEFAARLAPEWASFPTMSGRSYYGQPVKSFEQLRRYYEAQLKLAKASGSDWNTGMGGRNWPAGVPKPGTPMGTAGRPSPSVGRDLGGAAKFPGGYLGKELQLKDALSQVGRRIRERLGAGIPNDAIVQQRNQLVEQEISNQRELAALEEKIYKLNDKAAFLKLRNVVTGRKDIEQRVRTNELARAELAALAPMSQERQEALFLEIRGKKEIADLERENLDFIKSVLANNKYTREEQDALINAAAANVAYAKERNRLDAENLQIAQKRRSAEGMIDLAEKIRLRGLGAKAGFFGSAASAYEDELRISGNIELAIDRARLTRAQEIKNAVVSAQEELLSLMDKTNQVIGAAAAIGGAFSDSFKGIAAGSMSAQEALASFFQRTADHFLDMASRMLSKWVELEIMNRLLPLFGRTAPSVSGLDLASSFLTSSFQMPSYMAGASVPTPFANGGAFTNSIVSSPTLFKFANGGAFETGQMGEAGPEAVMPLTRGPGGRLGVDASGSGGDVNVVVNVDASGSNVQGDNQRAGQLGQVIATAVRQELVNQKRPGGLLAQ